MIEENFQKKILPSQNKLVFNKYNAWLAPLAGYSDMAMRLLCRQYGAKICVTEMVSAKGLVYGGKNTRELLKTCAEDSPLIVQIFGNEAEFLVEATAILQHLGFEYFDINMGCSVPKVAKTGAGAAMLKDIDNLLKCAEAMLKQSKGKTGFKFRLGYDMHKPVWKDFVPSLCEMGALYLVLHPRYAKQLFSGEAQEDALRELKECTASFGTPIIASGDLMTARKGFKCVKNTGVDSLMFARGALENPAIFQEYLALINNEEKKERTLDDAFKMVLEYAELCKLHFPERALPRMRTFVPRILKYFHSVSHLRKAIVDTNSWEQFNSALYTYYRMQTGKDYEAK